MDSIQDFENLCRALENPSSTAAASQALEALRSNPKAVALCRGVIEHSNLSLAQFQAAVTIRYSVIRSWPSMSHEERSDIRDWCLGAVANRGGKFEKSVIHQLIVAVAVMWKRGWLEEPLESRNRFFDHVTQLLSADGPSQMLGARLSLTLVQEMDRTRSTKASALGLSQNFHKETASSFQNHGLREVFTLCSKLLIMTIDTTNEIHEILLEVIVNCLHWDFSGLNNNETRVRVSPGRLWSEVLGDPDQIIMNSIFGLYSRIRITHPESNITALCRQSFILFAALSGEVFSNPQASSSHGLRLITNLCDILSQPLLGGIPSLLSMHSSLSEEDAYACGDSEALETLGALAHALRTYKLTSLLELPGSQETVGRIISSVSSLTTGLLDQVHGAAFSLLQALSDPLAATLHFDPMAALSAPSIPQLSADAARSAVEELLETRFSRSLAVVDAALDAWVALMLELEPPGSLSDPTFLSRQGPQHVLAVQQLCARMRPAAADLFARCVHARLAMGAALMRCNVDDDSPFEDKSTLKEHLELLAVVGRFAAAQALPLLQSLMARARAALRTLRAGSELALVERELRFQQLHETFWWLTSYTGALLADEATGETPIVPDALNVLSRSEGSKSGRCPVVALSKELLGLAGDEALRLAVPSATVDLPSPLLAERICWALGRWAKTYLFAAVQIGGPKVGSKIILSEIQPNDPLAIAFGSSNESILAPQTLEEPFPAAPLLCLRNDTLSNLYSLALNEQQQFSYNMSGGGIVVLETLLVVAAACVGIWGGRESEADVALEALHLLSVLFSSDRIGPFSAVSPVSARLCAAVAAMTSGGSLSAEIVSGGAPVLLSNGAITSFQFLSYFRKLSPELQGRLFSAVVCLTRNVGAGLRGFSRARELALSDSAFLAATSPQKPAYPGSTSSTEIPQEEVLQITALWGRFTAPLLGALRARLAVVVGSQELQQVARTGTIDASTEREVERLLSICIACVHAPAGLPHSWHLGVTVEVLRLCESLVGYLRNASSASVLALRFLLEFLEIDFSDFEGWGLGDVAYSVVKAVFRTYSTVHKHQFEAIAIAASKTPSSSNSGLNALLSEEEEHFYEDLLLLLTILDRIVDKEALELGAPVVGGQQSLPLSSEAVLLGLSFIMPLMSQSLVHFPRLMSSYSSLISHLLSQQPAAVARLDPQLFTTFCDNLHYSLQHAEVDVVSSALQSVYQMGLCHSNARRNASYSVFDLTPHLQRQPDLFQRFSRTILQLLLGKAQPPQEIIGLAADALLSMILADWPGFCLLVTELLGSLDPQLRQPVGSEFDLLLEAFHALEAGHSGPVEDMMARRAGRKPAVDRQTKLLFRRSFPAFVEKVRSLTTFF